MAEKYRKKSSNKNLLRNIVDKYIFIVFFLSGALAIVFVKLVFESMFLAILAPAFLILLYAYLLINHPQWRLREDRAGDNVYYLGFLYTLTSLSVALYRFSSEGSVSEEIVSNFGIALITTILGIALRVVFQQMRTELGEIEDKARISLGDAVLQFQMKMQESIDSFESYQLSMKQKVDEVIQNSAKTMGDEISNSYTELHDLTEAFKETISDSFKMITTSIDALNNNAVAVAESTGKLVTKIDSVNIPGNIFEEKLFPATQSISNSLEKLASKIQAQHAPFDDMYQVISRTSDSLSNIEAHAAHLSRFSEVLKNTEDTMGNLSREVAGVSESYRLLQEKNNLVSEVTEAELKQRSQRIQELSRDYESQAASLRKIEEVLSREASNIEEVSGKFAGAITKLANAIASDLEK